MYESQYGFRENHSTVPALMEFIENITQQLDSNMITLSVFIDLNKAFDTIAHLIVLKKLSFYGIRGIASDWISNYLDNRFQYVHYNNESSSRRKIVMWSPSRFDFRSSVISTVYDSYGFMLLNC